MSDNPTPEARRKTLSPWFQPTQKGATDQPADAPAKKKRPLPKGWTPGCKVDPDHPFAEILFKLSALAGAITKAFKTEQGKILLAALTHVANLKVKTRFVAYTSDLIEGGELFGGKARFVGFHALRDLVKKAGVAKKSVTAAFIKKTFLEALAASEEDMLDSEVWE